MPSKPTTRHLLWTPLGLLLALLAYVGLARAVQSIWSLGSRCYND